MTRLRPLKPVVLALAFAAMTGPLCLGVEELPTLQVVTPAGLKVLKKVKILEAKPDGLRLSHEDGAGTFPYAQLPAALRKKYEPAAPDVPAVPASPAPAKTEPAAEPDAEPAKTGPAAPAMTEPAKKEASAAAEVDDDIFSLKPEDGQQPGPQGSKDAPPKTKGVVLIQGESGSATGFIVAVGEIQYIYTAVHVLTGIDSPVFKTVEGRVLPVNSKSVVELSDTPEVSDVARIRLPKTQESATFYSLAGEVPAIGAAIQALGNSSGEGVMTMETGEVAGVGPGEIEISNGVVQGNSGGPVVLQGTGSVVGLVTRASKEKLGNVWTRDTRFADVRRFAAIPTKVTRWTPMLLDKPRAQMKRLETFRADSRALASVLYLTYAPDGITPTARTVGDFDVREALQAAASRPAGQSIIAAIADANRKLTRVNGQRKSENTVKNTYAAFFNSIRMVCNSGAAIVDPGDYIPVLAHHAAHEGALRKAVIADVAALEKQIGAFDFIRR